MPSDKPYITAGGWAYEQLKDSARHMRKYPTEAEENLWEHLRCQQMGVKVRRQQIIDCFIVDFVCLEKQLVIEVDGGYHNELEQEAMDSQREGSLNHAGYTVLRFTNEEVMLDTDNTINRIKLCLNEQTIK